MTHRYDVAYGERRCHLQIQSPNRDPQSPIYGTDHRYWMLRKADLFYSYKEVCPQVLVGIDNGYILSEIIGGCYCRCEK